MTAPDLTAAPRRRPAHLFVDTVAVLLLVGLALLGLTTTFAGWSFLILGVAAAAIASAAVVLTMRLPLAVPLSVVLLGGIVLGGPLALRSTGLGAGVPDLGTMADVLRGTVTGWGELLATLPPVDLAGPPALVPFLLGYVGGALAAGLAIRTRSAGLPVLPLLVVLVVVLLLRRPISFAQDWYPVGFAAIAVIWMVLRGVELAPASVRTRGWSDGWRQAAGAAVVITTTLLLAVTITGAGASSAGDSLRGVGGTPGDVSGLDSPLRRFRTFTAQGKNALDNVNDKRLLTLVGAPRGSRLRIVTLDRYDGREWRPGNDTMRGSIEDAFLRVDSTVDNGVSGRRFRVRVELAKAYRSAWVPSVGALSSFRFQFVSGLAKRDQLRYDLATYTAVVPQGLGPGDDYEFTAVLPTDRLRASAQAWKGTVLEVAGMARVDPLISKVLASPEPAMSKVFALARYLRVEGRYSDGVGAGEAQYRAGHDLERLVDDFLLAPRPVGDDEQYAAAMALLSNRVGVPARVVVGAVIPPSGIIRGKDVHAWVELRVADGSWRTLPTKEFMGNRRPHRNMTPAPPPQLLGSLAQPPPSQPRDPDLVQPETPQQKAAKRQESEARRGLVLRSLPWLALLSLALLVPIAKLVRRVRRRRRGRPSDQIAGAWSELVDRARELGVPVPATASRPTQARSLGTAMELALGIDDGVFAAAQPAPAEVERTWKGVGVEVRDLARRQRWQRRSWAPFNPVALLRRPGSRPD
ncbi:MAG: transglutaminaseTgpA domain-containing protein [Marmoricola sp.]